MNKTWAEERRAEEEMARAKADREWLLAAIDYAGFGCLALAAVATPFLCFFLL